MKKIIIVSCLLFVMGCATVSQEEQRAYAEWAYAQIEEAYKIYRENNPDQPEPDPQGSGDSVDSSSSTDSSPTQPSPGPSDGFYVTRGGKRIPMEKINSTSDDYLLKRQSDTAPSGTSVILFPAEFVGAIEMVQVNGAKYNRSTREKDEGSMEAWPNGARDHWKGPTRNGKGVITAIVNGEPWASGVLDLNRARNERNWELRPKEPEPTTPQPTIPTEIGPDSDTASSFDGTTLRVAESLAVPKMVLHKAGLAATGYHIAKPGPQMWTVPTTYTKGTAQGQTHDLVYDIDIRSGKLKAIYTDLTEYRWPADVDRSQWVEMSSEPTRDKNGLWKKHKRK